jgi:hypothetical protein
MHKVIGIAVLLAFIVISAVVITIIDEITGTTVEAELLQKTVHSVSRIIYGAIVALLLLWIGE